MAITYYIGRSGTGKTRSMQQEIVQKMKENPTGPPIIYIVPDQMTFQAEVNIIKQMDQAMTRTHVLSFSRLALRTLQEVGGIARYHIQKSGIQMLLRKIIEKNKSRFQIFQKAANSQGFLEQIEQMVTEMKRYEVNAVSLEISLSKKRKNGIKTPREKTLEDKLHDIQIILAEMESELDNKYLESEDYLLLLAEKIHRSDNLKNAEIFIDGFHSFTPIEMNVLQQLFMTVKNVKISLTLPRHIEKDEYIDSLDLFYETSNTYQKLSVMCEEHHLSPIKTEIFEENKRFSNPSLAYLEKMFEIRPADPFNNHQGITVISAVNRRAEVESVAREIISLVRDENYRFSEIAILLRNMDDYVDYFETVFHDEHIPIFMDQKRSMLNHPLVEFIRSSLEMIQRNWRYETVFRLLKTELLFPIDRNQDEMREKVDQLENYALSYGIQGGKWYRDEEWSYHRMATTTERTSDQTNNEKSFEKEMNQLRHQLLTPMYSFQEKMKETKTIKARCETLFLLLEEINAMQKIEQLRDHSSEANDLRAVREHDQVWGEIIELLDQMVEMSGNEEVSFDVFFQMVDAGLETLKFSIIPPAFDQVVIADIENSRLSDIRSAFIIGVNDGIIPAKPDEGSMISEEERELLDKQGLTLAPGASRQLLNESFLLYMAQSVPSEKLYFSYPLANEEGKSLQPSMVINHLEDIFPNLLKQVAFDTPLDVKEEEQLTFVTHPEKTLSHLTYLLQAWQRGYRLSPLWWDTYNWLMKQPIWKRKAEQVLASLQYRNEPLPLPSNLTKTLYGTKLHTSVSRLEQYNSCPFSQFANYGLNLKERETYKLEAPDIGTLFHAALKNIAELLQESGRDFSDLTKEESATMSKNIVEQLAPKIQRKILLSSNRYYYLKQKLEEVVARASFVLAEQARKTGFSPTGLEVGFGLDQQLPSLKFQLENNCSVELIGRIDRVDKAETVNGLLVRILDYKSSKQDIQLDDVYYGLALQMLIYLDVVVSFSKEWLGTEVTPSGVLYFHVHNPIIQAKEKLSLERIEEEILKQFKMKGLISASTDVINEMDHSLEKGYSSIVPVGLKADGTPYANSSIISNTNYDMLRAYLRTHVKKVGQAILDGDIELKPYKTKQKVACTYCPYRSFCQFDPSIESNDYRYLSKKSDDEILNLINNEGGGKNEDDPKTE